MSGEGVSYQYDITVSSKDIDALNHVNNVVYVQWINEVAEKHWNIISDVKLNSKYFWVVLKHEINYLGQAMLNDVLTIKTKVGESQGVKSIRYVHIFKDDKQIIEAKTTWCLMDRETLKPKRMPTEIINVLYEK